MDEVTGDVEVLETYVTGPTDVATVTTRPDTGRLDTAGTQGHVVEEDVGVVDPYAATTSDEAG